MTPENRAEVLPRFFHASKQQAKAVAAEIAPREAAPRRAVVTAFAPPPAPAKPFHLVETPAAQVCLAASPLALSQSFHPGETVAAHASDSAPQRDVPARAPAPRTAAEPLTADLRRLHVTVSKRFLEKLEAARDALSPSHPGADAEAIREAGLDLVIERAAKRKGICARPKAEKASPHPRPSSKESGARDAFPDGMGASRHIPVAVMREVWVRDGGCCQWPLDGGGICGSTHRLQFDHIQPVALGGKSTFENGRLLCSLHNNLAARQIFGDEWMDRFVSRPTRPPSPPATPGRWLAREVAPPNLRWRAPMAVRRRGPVALAVPPRRQPLLARGPAWRSGPRRGRAAGQG